MTDAPRLLQVHAEECQRLATEAAVARARASGAARADMAAAAARAAEQAACEAMTRWQRDAAEIYDRWRLRCVRIFCSGLLPGSIVADVRGICKSRGRNQRWCLLSAGRKRLSSKLPCCNCTATRQRQLSTRP